MPTPAADLSVGVLVAVVSMVGTLFALSLLAGCIALLRRALPEQPEPAAAEPASSARPS